MKLWMLEPNASRPDKGTEWVDPWTPSYDTRAGFVVRAASEADARRIADENSGAENGDPWTDDEGRKRHPWLDPGLSTCAELLPDGETGVILLA